VTHSKRKLFVVNLEDHPSFFLQRLWSRFLAIVCLYEYIAPDAQGRSNLADHLVQTSASLNPKQILKWLFNSAWEWNTP